MIVSIISPVFNEEKYIQQTIESFLQQEHASFDVDILLCDGMSTDKTRNIIKEYAEKYPNVRLIDNPKRKTPFAFNIGLKEAKGEYVAILGAHSAYDKNYLQACYDDLIATNSVGCSGRVITQSAYPTTQAKLCEWAMLSSFGVSGNSFRVMKEGYVHSVNFPVFKKQALLDVGGYNETLERNQDNDMNQRLIDAGHQLYCTWKTKCFYRPPADLNKFFKYAYRGGFWNAKSFFMHKRSMRIHHFVPFIFVVSLFFSLIGGGAEILFKNTFYLISLFGFIIALHLLIGMIVAALSMREDNDNRKIFLPFIFFGFHFNYGWGTLRGFLSKK